MTNGEMIKKMFPEADVNRNGFLVECELEAFGFTVEEKWWDAEYKGRTVEGLIEKIKTLDTCKIKYPNMTFVELEDVIKIIKECCEVKEDE